jgi:hypothetical protein
MITVLEQPAITCISSTISEYPSFVNVLNLHIIDLAKQYYTHLQRELRKKKKERKNGRILINRIPHSKSE